MEIESTNPVPLSRQQSDTLVDMFDPLRIAQHWTPLHHLAWRQASDLNHFFLYFPNPLSGPELSMAPDIHADEYSELLERLFLVFGRSKQQAEIVQGRWGILSLSMRRRNGLQCYSMYQHVHSILSSRGASLERKISRLRQLWKSCPPSDDPQLHSFLSYLQNLGPMYSRHKSADADST